MTTPDLLTPKEAAELLRVTPDTLESWRAKRTGPAWFKLGDSKRAPVRYRRADLEAYLQQQRQA